MMNKNKTTKKIIKYFNINKSEYRVHLTASILKEAIAFSNGFLSCVRIIVEEPVREEELKKLIFDETIKYITNTIDGIRH